MSWDTETGYVIDTEYIRQVFREMLPFHLAHVCALRGLSSRLATDPGNWALCELGCGAGLNSLMMAAAHPEARVIGVDMNPAHIAGASDLAAKAGLDNVRFIEASFADLLHRDLPDFDFITLHGVYSWIKPEHRADVVDLIARKLKPGGLVYLSYNSMPGWASMAPMRHLMVDTTAHLKVSSTEKAKRALGFIKEMAALEGRFFKDHPRVVPTLEKMEKMDPRYLAHEYLNSEWHPQYSAEVSAEMARARLTWVADAEVRVNFPEFWLSPPMLGFLAKAENTAQRETWKDFLLDTQFRRDVFIKGRQESKSVTQEALLAPYRYGAFDETVLPENFKLGSLTITPGEEIKQAFCAIVESPRSQQQLMALGQAAGTTPAKVRSALYMLVAAGKVQPCHGERYGERKGAALSLTLPANRAFLEDARVRGGEAVLLSPLTSTPISGGLPFLQVTILDGLLRAMNRQALVQHVSQGMREHRLLLNDAQQKPINDPEILTAALAVHIEEFERVTLPRLIRYGVVA